MATSSILSTHSGHHRIFIGPVVQKQMPQPNGSSVSAASRQKHTPSHRSHSHQPSGARPSTAPKPWWDQGSSFLRSRLSLHSQTHAHAHQPSSTNGHRNPSLSADPLRQTSIPQFSYTFSDDSSSSDNDGESFDAEADETDAYDSESERRDYEHDHDDVDDEDGHAPSSTKRSALERTFHTSTSTSSSESLSAPVAQSQDREHQHDQEDRPGTRKDKGKARADDPAPVSRVRTSREKKRTKSMRDEGEPNRLKKLLGSYREHRHNQGRMENPDLGWESDGSSGLQRGATWVTAREYASSIGHGSLYQQAIQEEDDEQDEEDHREDPLDEMDGNERTHGTTENKSTAAKSGEGKDIEPPKATDPTQKEPLSATISKAGTRLGRALLNRTPTGLNREDGEDDRTKVPTTQSKRQPVESMCSLDKDCQKSVQSQADVDDSQKKHVRFLTKVQYQMSSSRQSTMLSTHPVLKQDRMLVRKEMTERPGPHVFNSNTARRLERQSQGWAEWWCVLKGPPTGQKSPVTKIHKKSKSKYKRAEKGRLEFYYNHKKIKGAVVLSSCTSVSVYSSLDYSIAVTQNYPEDLGLTIYILRPRTISLACAWYMEIYTLLNGDAPIPPFIEIAVPDFDVKIRVPIPADSETETEDDTDDDEGAGTSLSSTLPPQDQDSQTGTGQLTDSTMNETPFQSFKTARTSLPERMASKTFYLTNEHARPTLVAPDEVTPKLLRSHVLSLLKDVPDWMEVVKMWQDPGQFGDVALCWKRYDRIEWIYWTERIPSETDDAHLKRDHIGFADGSDWSGRMDETVVGPQVLDKTHVLELRPITHYPTKVIEAGGHDLHEPDPIEGYLVRVSTFTGNPIRRFRRLYLTSHDHMLIYTIPSQAHSPTMPHTGAIDPTALMFCISPHRSANPDHKDMAQSRSVRRLKAQVRAARGFIDMTKIETVRVLTVQQWDTVRHMSYKQGKDQEKAKLSKRERLGKAVQRGVEIAEEARTLRAQRANASGAEDAQAPLQPQPEVILREPDNYFFPTVVTEPLPQPSQSLESQAGSSQQAQQKNTDDGHGLDADSLERSNNTQSQDVKQDEEEEVGEVPPRGTIGEGLIKSATMVADMLLHNDEGQVDEDVEDSNVIEIEMKGGPCVRFRAFNAEAAHLWCTQLHKLAHYWALRKHQDVRGQMRVTQSNCQLASSLDDDEIQVGETIQDWDNDRAMVSPEIWNWCVVNGCRSVTKSGVLYYKPRLHSTFRKMFLVLTEGYLLLFHPHRRSKTSGQVIPTTTCKLFGIHSLTDIYVYSGHFADEDTAHGTNDESERLPRFYPDGLIVDDPDEDCTFSIWRGQRKKMFSRRGAAARTMMSSRAMEGPSRIFGKDGCLSSIVKDGVVYGAKPQSCSVLRARSRADLEQWVHAINTEIERCVRAERRGVRTRKYSV
ncbi:hypothetical protein EC968_002636 [Mortierella alpina]|nr:hypothetical protein EC968_002636 [Mortierella alpina]